MLNPRSTYYWRVLCKNARNPQFYMHSYQSLSHNDGYGIKSFTTPASFPPPNPTVKAKITNIMSYTSSSGWTYSYATLDNVNPSSTSSSCPGHPLALPSGWSIADNSKRTLHSILISKHTVNPPK